MDSQGSIEQCMLMTSPRGIKPQYICKAVDSDFHLSLRYTQQIVRVVSYMQSPTDTMLHTTDMTSNSTFSPTNRYHQNVKGIAKQEEKRSLIMIIDRSDLSITPGCTRMRVRR